MRRKLIPAIVFLGLVTAGFAKQQGPPAPRAGSAEDSYRKARAVLDAALKAHGNDISIQSISVRIRGGQYHRNQSPKATGDPISTPFQATLVADFNRKWTIWERTGSFPGGIEFSNRWILKGTAGVNIDLLRKTVAQQSNAEAFAEGNLRRLPLTLLAQAVSRAATLRWLGESDADGQKLVAISYATTTGATLSLSFDASSHLLMRWENMQSDPLRGDVLAETIIKGYDKSQKIPLPTGQITRLGGQLTQDVDYSAWVLDAALPDSQFVVPEGMRPAVVSASAAPSAGARGAEPPSVHDLGDGLYSIEGVPGYRVLFQEFRAFVMVFEAPQNEANSQTMKRLVREKIPNKKIGYVALTHHHDDHSGGLRSYWADCIPVITTPGNQQFLRDSLASPFTIQADTFSRNTPNCSGPLADYILDKRGVFTDGEARVEAIDIGPSPHADEMLVFWFPKQRVIFQGDLWNREADGTTRPATDTTLHFAAWLEKSGLPVEQIIGVHGPSGTPAELQEAVRLRAAQK